MSATRTETASRPCRPRGTRQPHSAQGGPGDNRPHRSADARTVELVVAQISAVRIACRRITGEHLKPLRDSVQQACRTSAAVPWDRKALAHAGFFDALADAVGDNLVAPVLRGGAGLAYDLMSAAGSQTEAMIIGSRRCFLAHLQTGDAEAAALEMERHLDVLYYMWHLAHRGAEPPDAA